MFTIRDLQINDYFINLDINENENIGIFSEDKTAKDLLLCISGINKSEILHNNVRVFENEKYFNKRIYIDNNKKYIDSLNEDTIENVLMLKYSKLFDKDYFKNCVRKYHIRTIKNNNSFKNDIFALSIRSIKLINEAYLGLELDDINQINKEFNSNKGFIISDNIENIDKYNGVLDKAIILNNNNVDVIIYGDGNEK